MNKKMTTYILGKMLGVEAAVLLIPALVSVIYKEDGWKFFLITGGILAILYFLLGSRLSTCQIVLLYTISFCIQLFGT